MRNKILNWEWKLSGTRKEPGLWALLLALLAAGFSANGSLCMIFKLNTGCTDHPQDVSCIGYCGLPSIQENFLGRQMTNKCFDPD